jgi:hypothetical protein
MRIVFAIVTVFFACVLFAAVPDADRSETIPATLDRAALEESGEQEPDVLTTAKQQQKIQLNRLGQVLLIPESTADVVGMYDPYDGTYLGDLILNSPALMSTPINAIPGPDGNIYLSDQVSDAVFVYDTLGTYLYTYADASDGLNNIRGIDFRDEHLFVTSGDDYVREFSGPHTFVRDFIADGTDPFDILFLEDGRALLADIQGTTDNIRLYDTSGTFLYQLFAVSFPEQIQTDAVLPGEFLNVAFSDNVVTDFELNGTIITTLPFSGGPRGIYRLGNGNLLATNGTGIYELDAATGAILQTENTGSGRFIELYTAPGAQSFFWDFEDGLQGWTHTNGLPFPYGWDVEPSGYYPAWTPPDAGDSTMWIDSDASGSGTWVQDTTMSPALVPPAGLAWLKYGVGYNWISSGEFLEVGIKYFNGSSWNVVALKTYTEDTGPLWDSVDVSAYGGYDSVQVYFYYDDNNIWAWYLAFDNVGLYAAATVDAATISIDVPGAYVMPATSIDPTATYRNNGASTETFDVYYVIDTSGVNLYSETYSVTVDALAETTVVFPSMTTPGEGTVLDITAYAVLAGDVNPGNDTLTQTTVVQSAFWKVYSNSMPAAVYYHACVYSDVTGTPTVYSLGGYTAAAISTIYEFDCNTETWSTAAATLNHAVWRQAAATVGGRIYVFGGYDASTVVQNYNQEYDPVAGTVTDKTPMPTARQFLGAVAWQDTLIYVIGGQSTGYYDIVEIYNPATDSWTNGTALPITNRSFAIGISGDTIYITGGYNSSAYVSATYIGVIDPVDPTVITWTAGPMIPTGPSTQAGRSRVQGACVEGKFYFTCGDDHGVEAHDTWYYDPADAQWHQTLDKPTAISNTQCAVYVPVLDGGTFFCPGGYNTATSSGTNAVEGLVNLSTGIEENPLVGGELASFGFAPMRNPTRDPMISYATSMPGRVVLKVYDGAGRLIQTLVNSELPAGVKTVHWDTRAIANGVYFLRLEAENNSATQKMILVK